MTRASEDSLRGTLPRVFENKALIAEKFYEALFRRVPEAEALFVRDFGRQKDVFATLLAKIAQYSEQPEALDDIAGDVVKIHRVHGVTAEQYESARQALIEAFAETMSDCLSAEELARWANAGNHLVQRTIELSA